MELNSTLSKGRLDDSQIIQKIVERTGLTINRFAEEIGLKRSENIYQITRGKNGISKDLADKITDKYPDINRTWIITGEGEMYVGDALAKKPVPCYDMDVTQMVRMETLPQPAYIITMPRMKDATFAGTNMNAAMEPDIPNGATVVVCQITPEQIIPGYPYVVVTDNIAVLRRLKKEPANDKIRLVASNPDFDDIVIDICEIRKLLMVKGHIYYNQ